LEKRNFLFSIFLIFYQGLIFEMIHEPPSLEEGMLAEAAKLCSTPRLTRLSLMASGDLTNPLALLSVTRARYFDN